MNQNKKDLKTIIEEYITYVNSIVIEIVKIQKRTGNFNNGVLSEVKGRYVRKRAVYTIYLDNSDVCFNISFVNEGIVRTFFNPISLYFFYQEQLDKYPKLPNTEKEFVELLRSLESDNYLKYDKNNVLFHLL